MARHRSVLVRVPSLSAATTLTQTPIQQYAHASLTLPYLTAIMHHELDRP